MKRDPNLNFDVSGLDDLRLRGLKVAIVGGTGGIGRALSHQLTDKGASVLVVGQTFRDQKIPGIEFMKANLGLMSEARHVASALPAETLDIVVFTTGTMAGPKREVTAEGLERDLAISYLSRFVILNGIAPRLGAKRPDAAVRPRVFVMGFPGSGQKAVVDDLNSERKYGRISAHFNTVAGNEVLVLDAARRFKDVDFFGLNPGFVKTDIRGNLFGSRKILAVIEWLTSFMTIEPETYAERLTPLLVSPSLNHRSGAMFNNKAEAILPSTKSTESSYADALMAASENLVARASPVLSTRKVGA